MEAARIERERIQNEKIKAEQDKALKIQNKTTDLLKREKTEQELLERDERELKSMLVRKREHFGKEREKLKEEVENVINWSAHQVALREPIAKEMQRRQTVSKTLLFEQKQRKAELRDERTRLENLLKTSPDAYGHSSTDDAYE